ncbi:hypothetical protein HPP92_001795 [Vanilla planifolia]|uniref:Uncharacterized protein n=1 Tax=Vanilla planifolia TaxID=51239 RepID=A0A835RSA7_VANPL|nr:hypothetical protein HPP92_001795 [Vanilla planifolia]
MHDEVKTPEANDVGIEENYQEDDAHCSEDQLTTEEFSMKRVEHWISQIGIHGDLIVEEPRENSSSVSEVDSSVLCGVDSSKTEGSVKQAMGVAYKYISSLTPASSSAQLVKLGLIAIPMLSPFIGLRVLNLSGNAIVRITPGSSLKVSIC